MQDKEMGGEAMKPAKQWVAENTQSGAFDCVHSCADAEILVREIQDDARQSICAAIKDLPRDACIVISRHIPPGMPDPRLPPEVIDISAYWTVNGQKREMTMLFDPAFFDDNRVSMSFDAIQKAIKAP